MAVGIFTWWRNRADRARVEKAEAPPMLQALLTPWQTRDGLSYNFDIAEYLKAMGDQYVWVYACVHKLATSISRLPLRFYRSRPDGEKQPITDGPLPALFDYVNPSTTLHDLLYLLSTDLSLAGNHYWHLLKPKSGGVPVAEIWRMRPDLVKVKPGGAWVEGYILQVNDKRIPFTAEEVAHFKHPDPASDFLGLPPLRAAALAADTDKRAAEANRNMMARGFKPDVWVEMPGLESEKDQEKLDAIQRKVDRRLEGKQHGAHLVVPGTKITPAQFAPREMEFQALKRMTREEICAVFGVPPPLVGILDRATYCLPADARVAGPEGCKRIAEIKPGDQVWSYVEGRLKKRRVTWAGQTGVKQLFGVCTRNRLLRATDNHPVLVRVPGRGDTANSLRGVTCEWRQIRDLRPGDWIVQPLEWPDSSGERLPDGTAATPEVMQFLGAVIGDGTVDAAGVRMCVPENDRVAGCYRELAISLFTKQAVQSGGGLAIQATVPREPITLREVRHGFAFSSAAEARRLTEWGFGGRAKTKRIPGWVFGLRRELRLAFLAGLADTDGYIDRRGLLCFTFANKQLTEDVKDLLLSVGIVSSNLHYNRLSAAVLPNVGRQEFYENWVIVASAAERIAEIPFADPVYRERVEANNGIRKRIGKKAWKAGLVGLGFFRVKSILPQEAEPVYDLTVEGGHSFVADGVVVHNSNIETAQEIFWGDTVWNHADLIARTITEHVLPRFGDDLSCRFDFSDVEALQDSDLDEQAHDLSLVQMGVLTRNEYRAKWEPDLEPLDGGDEALVPATYLPAGEGSPEGEEAPAKIYLLPGGYKALPEAGGGAHPFATGVRGDRIWKAFDQRVRRYEARLARVAARLIREHTEAVLENMRRSPRAAAEKAVKGIEEIDAWLFDVVAEQQRWRGELLPQYEDILTAEGKRALAEEGADPLRWNIYDPRAQDHLRKREVQIQTIVGNRYRELREDLAEGYGKGETIRDLMGRVEQYGSGAGWKAERIARTEVVGSANAGAYVAYDQLGLGRVWIATRDDRIRDAHRAMDDQKVGPGQPFTAPGGATAMHPGGFGVARLDINCRCTVGAVKPEDIEPGGVGQPIEPSAGPWQPPMDYKAGDLPPDVPIDIEDAKRWHTWASFTEPWDTGPLIDAQGQALATKLEEARNALYADRLRIKARSEVEGILAVRASEEAKRTALTEVNYRIEAGRRLTTKAPKTLNAALKTGEGWGIPKETAKQYLVEEYGRYRYGIEKVWNYDLSEALRFWDKATRDLPSHLKTPLARVEVRVVKSGGASFSPIDRQIRLRATGLHGIDRPDTVEHEYLHAVSRALERPGGGGQGASGAFHTWYGRKYDSDLVKMPSHQAEMRGQLNAGYYAESLAQGLQQAVHGNTWLAKNFGKSNLVDHDTLRALARLFYVKIKP